MLGMRVAPLVLWFGVGSLGPALAADTVPLEVKPGLWEMTSDTEHSGAPPLPPAVLAQMSPEQRAKIEAAMKGAMGPQHGVHKHCVTQDDIARGFEKMPGQCTQTVTSSSATTREGTFQCSGSNISSGSYRVRASSPESVVVDVNVTMSNAGSAMTRKTTGQGKWLGADCGDVKPSGP
jgi:uncharacterized protein DUF3617